MKKLAFSLCAMLTIIFCCVSVQAAEYVYLASVQGELPLHISPHKESYAITPIPACSKLRLIKTERTWGLVEFNNKCGWINLSFTRDTYDHAAEATGNDSVKNVKISSDKEKTSLYSVPSVSEMLGSEEKYAVPNETVLKITRSTDSGWGLVSMNGKYAWVQLENTTDYRTEAEKNASDYGIYYVYVLSEKGEGLKLLSKPGGGNVYAVIPDCVKLTVREKKDNYAYVSYDGMNGWIDLRYTAQSLSNAQSAAGVTVNAEYEISPTDGGSSVKMCSIPSDNPNDGGMVVGSVEKATAVFVQRSTLSGWSLINYDGVMGWIPPGNTVLAPSRVKNEPQVLKKPKVCYVSTSENKGIKLYSEPGSEDAVATVPECVKVSVIAKEGDYEYVYSDYAAGWKLSGNTVKSYDEALKKYSLKRSQRYMVKETTNFMSLPTNSPLCGSVIVSEQPEGVLFTVTKIVSVGKKKWGYTEIDGMKGWINLSHAKRATHLTVLLIILSCEVVAATAAVVIIILNKRKNKERF